MDHVMTWSGLTDVLFPVVTAALGVQWWIYRIVSEERERRLNLEKDLHDFKEKVAREHVTQETLDKFEQRLLQAIERLGDRLDKIIMSKVN